MDTKEFGRWLRTREAEEFLDACVLGSLELPWADEVATDFDFDLRFKQHRTAFRAEINAALAEGN